MNEMKQERLGVTAIEAETGVRPRTMLDFDPNLMQERDGETVVNPEMTDGQHRDAVKKTIDQLLCLQLAVAMNEHERWAKTSEGQKCESGQWETRMHESTISRVGRR